MKYFLLLCISALLSFSACQNNNNQNGDDTQTENGIPDSVRLRQDGNGTPPEVITSNQPMGKPGMKPEFSPAKIDRIQIIDTKNPDFIFVMAEGILPSPCTNMGEITQSRSGNNINVVINTFIPPGVSCPTTQIPLHHSVQVNTKDLPKGAYVININGRTTTYVR